MTDEQVRYALRTLAEAVLEIRHKAARTWDCDGETLVSAGLNYTDFEPKVQALLEMLSRAEQEGGQ